MTSECEARLVTRLHAGEDAAYDDLVRMTGGRMLAIARRMMGREEDAQDAVQDAFLSAFKAIHRFDSRARLTTWLHRITVNACLMKLRSQRRRGGGERSIDDLLPQYLEDGHQKSPSRPWKPVEQSGIEQAEVRELVRAKIAELPVPYRVVILLRDIEELDTEATAELLGMSVAAVKTRLHRARQALKTLLDPCMTEGTL
jgi:RNA polymerase sigma-70 factor (ECF subfamily)